MPALARTAPQPAAKEAAGLPVVHASPTFDAIEEAPVLDAGAPTPESDGRAHAGEADSGTPDFEGEGDAPIPTDALPEPRLSALAVSGGATPMSPSFDPEIIRYAIRAAEPAATLELFVEAEPGSSVFVDDAPVELGTTMALSTAEPGQDIELRVENAGGEERLYSLVYLPANFPELDVTVRKPGASTDPIYVALRNVDLQYLVKLDNFGVPYFYSQQSEPVFDFKKHPGGRHSYSVGRRNPMTQVVLDEQFREVDRVVSVDLVDTDMHEFHVLPNGNYLLMAYEPALRDASPYGGMAEQRVVDGVLQEITKEREVVFQWNSWDHLSYASRIKSDEDYAHLNSVVVDDDGNWLVSARGLSQVFKLDRKTGDVLWRLGGKDGDFTFVDDPFGNLCGQHTASRTPTGTLLLFDNGQNCWPEVPERGAHTRVAEYRLDEAAMTATLVFSYHREDAYTLSQGSAQRLQNGNTFIGWGQGPEIVASEVDANGEVVFELAARSAGGTLASYRAWRYTD